MAAGWQAVWAGRGLRARALLPVAWAFGAVAALRRALYRRGALRAERLPVPVIVVGNVVVGGAGKTPLAIALVRHLQSRGLVCGVIARGYGRGDGGVDAARAVHASSTATEVGDEPLLIHRATGAPVFVAPRRADAGRALLAAHPGVQVLLCDDGLQHLSLRHDLTLCVFDDRACGNGWLLPAGPLREPWPRPVDAVLRTAAVRIAGDAPQFDAPRRLGDHAVDASGRRMPLSALGDGPVEAVAGVARPESFFAMLRDAGLALGTTHALPDHYDFHSWKRSMDAGYSLLCTEKDAVKLWATHPHALAVPLVCTPEPAFFAWLDARLKALLAAPPSLSS